VDRSDQISHCTSPPLAEVATKSGVRPSMGSVGDCFDNVMCESFFVMLACELLDRRGFMIEGEVRLAGFDFVKGSRKHHG